MYFMSLSVVESASTRNLDEPILDHRVDWVNHWTFPGP